ncbi:histidine kinase dimerization/phosphoacceptor domain -containing protein [Sphingomonas sp.]|jgi:light-regulated signal transduction histidine kinase (bacteriophytochrome)|uniref:histidine kinase dimerization/phosphoacceptor domain -containing protein n=1 Tax=Sphingomonas sp. TaxID=28214 RepID=UPI002636F077|nr:histidine kinase dimerization/phosphoacceptor domain -containing protein [Sphingomonas sp.]MDF2493226.1 phytochrome [Sphingomonas sp.]
MASLSERAAPPLSECDREPIHIPGAIQPHGLLLIADPETLTVVAGAGALEEVFGTGWLGAPLAQLLAQDIAGRMAATLAGPGGIIRGDPLKIEDRLYDVAIHRGGEQVIVELEPTGAEPLLAGDILSWMDIIAAGFERASNLQMLCARAASAFRALTGFDRVMVYRFLDDEAGRVVGEDRDPTLGTFMHHHFPAADIPRQARALYVRNRARVIPDVSYSPAPIRPAHYSGTDLSDASLRSVSPIHVDYLRNMDVGASASISIVKDGVLWGLIACHNRTAKLMPIDIRLAATTLAGGLARQIRAKEEAESYRERLALRAAEDSLAPALTPPLTRAVGDRHDDLQRMLDADGVALVHAKGVDCYGRCPAKRDVEAIAEWLAERNTTEAFVTHMLASQYPPAAEFADKASGLLAVPVPEEQAILLWFRAEEVEEIEWAGNPHKGVGHDPLAILTPRTSFESWRETVRGRSRRWTLEQIEATHRLRRTFRDARDSRERQRLFQELERAVADKDSALAQKDVLMKEVDHRVQNSLQLVSAFLSLQARDAGPGQVADQLTEARSRLSAVALVHRRLYRDDQIETVDLGRYLEELVQDLRGSLGHEWASQMTVDLTPLLIPTDRAISVGLIASELVINATKYAYEGTTGPIDIALEQYRNRFRLIVADNGGGVSGDRVGFGSRMMQAVVGRLNGTLDHADNSPGLRAILTAPIEDGTL